MPERKTSHRRLIVSLEGLETRNLFAAAITDYLTVDTSITHQTMDGFGASMMSWAQRPEYRQAAYYNMLAGDLGANIVRAALEPGWETSNDNNDPNTFNWAGFNDASIATAMEYFKQMKLRGANEFMLTVWSPPAWMKTNKATTNGGVLRADLREEFAENLAAVVVRAKQAWGVDITTISIQNEPWFVETYDSAQLTPQQMVETMRTVIRRFKKDGITTRLALPEDVSRYNRFAQYAKAAMNDPEVAAGMGLWANHYVPAAGLTSIKNLIGGTGKHFWSTEVNNGTADLAGALGVARGIDDLVNLADASAVVMWQYSGQAGKDDFYALWTGTTPNPKYYAVKQYSHFIRPGAVRVDSKNDNDSVRVSAYTQSSNGAVTIVMSNNGTTDSTVQLNLKGTNLPASFNIYRTSATENCALVGSIASSELMNFTLPAQSIVTFYAGPELVSPTLTSAAPFVPLQYKRDSSNTNDLRKAAMAGKLSTVQSLIAGGADVNAAYTNGWTPMFEAAATPWWDSDKILTALINAGADVQHKDDEGFTALHIAAMNQNFGFPVPAWYSAARINVLVDAGINVNARDNYNRTPLHWAAMLTKVPTSMESISFDTSVVQALIDRGADINATDANGKTALDYAIAERNTATVTLLQSYLGTGQITGAVYNDTNGNGSRDAGETGAASRNVFIDLDNDGSYDNSDILALTDSTGAYAFQNLSAGTFVIRQIVPSGFTETTLNLPKTVTLSAGQFVSGINFFTKPTAVSNASVGGVVIGDNNGNGTYDAGDTVLSGITLFIDSNNNSSQDAGEPTALTQADGSYSFTGLAAGTYVVRRVLPSSWTDSSGSPSSRSVTLAAGQSITNANFYFAPALTQISGTVFNDANSNGAVDVGESGLPNQIVFIDANNNLALDGGETSVTTSATGAYVFNNLLAGTYRLRWATSSGYVQTYPLTNASQVVTPTPGQSINSINFGIKAAVGQITGIAFNDLNKNGVQDAGEAVLASRTIYIDANNNAALDAGEKSAVTDAAGKYTFASLSPATYIVRQVLPANWSQTFPLANAGATIAVTAGSNLTANFGSAQNAVVTASISGKIWKDTNRDARRTADELGIAGRTVYIDTNGNNALDVGETTAVTNSLGNYTFGNLAAGTYKIRQVLPAGWVQTKPFLGASLSVTVTATQTSIGNELGTNTTAAANSGVLSGSVFKDTNGNGGQDAGELGVAGRTIYLDANNNGKLDTGEVKTTTTSSGAFLFSNLAGNITYRVRQLLPTGWTQTKPTGNASVSVQLNDGQTYAGIVFGTKSIV